MKHAFILVLCAIPAFFLSACDSQVSGGSEKAQVENALFNLARMNGCIDCHRINATVIGPSWSAIAERYKDAPREAARALLIDSVKKGSVGKWTTWKGGDGMPPLEKRVSSEHIEQLVDYILSLDPTPNF